MNTDTAARPLPGEARVHLTPAVVEALDEATPTDYRSVIGRELARRGGFKSTLERADDPMPVNRAAFRAAGRQSAKLNHLRRGAFLSRFPRAYRAPVVEEVAS